MKDAASAPSKAGGRRKAAEEPAEEDERVAALAAMGPRERATTLVDLL